MKLSQKTRWKNLGNKSWWFTVLWRLSLLPSVSLHCPSMLELNSLCPQGLFKSGQNIAFKIQFSIRHTHTQHTSLFFLCFTASCKKTPRCSQLTDDNTGAQRRIVVLPGQTAFQLSWKTQTNAGRPKDTFTLRVQLSIHWSLNQTLYACRVKGDKVRSIPLVSYLFACLLLLRHLVPFLLLPPASSRWGGKKPNTSTSPAPVPSFFISEGSEFRHYRETLTWNSSVP